MANLSETLPLVIGDPPGEQLDEPTHPCYRFLDFNLPTDASELNTREDGLGNARQVKVTNRKLEWSAKVIPLPGCRCLCKGDVLAVDFGTKYGVLDVVVTDAGPAEDSRECGIEQEVTFCFWNSLDTTQVSNPNPPFAAP